MEFGHSHPPSPNQKPPRDSTGYAGICDRSFSSPWFPNLRHILVTSTVPVFETNEAPDVDLELCKGVSYLVTEVLPKFGISTVEAFTTVTYCEYLFPSQYLWLIGCQGEKKRSGSLKIRDRRRKESRRGERNFSQGQRHNSDATSHWKKTENREGSWRSDTNSGYDYGIRRETQRNEESYPNSSRNRAVRPSARERLSFSRDNEAISRRGNQTKSSTSGPRNEWRPVAEGLKSTTPARSSYSKVSHTPSPRPQREGISTQAGSAETNNKSVDGSIPSHERRSALERLSLPTERVPLLQDGVANSASGRLQEVDIQYLEDNLPLPQSGGINVASSSKQQRTPIMDQQEGFVDRSPIRTLSEDRIHVSLRLGPMMSSPVDRNTQGLVEQQALHADVPRLGATSKKGKGPLQLQPVTKKRTTRSSPQGLSVKRRRVTKTQNSPRRNGNGFLLLLGCCLE
ncbi:hypothetical protein HID58_021329 [Brassica napus]|uniref:Uncharacterized protein n=1 Tax=Brassica napus TaxID=3708 RepID=A0ABQ8CWB5_BRANA|nr:hypothetical protein HID58_021329 [Brassica napus]